MSREIKFRAWDKRTKVFIAVGFDILGETTCFDLVGQYLFEHKEKDETTLSRLIDVEVMQFTGLKDKSGKEIYEGDVVSYELDFAKWVIEYKANAFFGKYIKSNLNVYQQDLENKNYLQFEVIGNIYSNPELLK